MRAMKKTATSARSSAQPTPTLNIGNCRKDCSGSESIAMERREVD